MVREADLDLGRVVVAAVLFGKNADFPDFMEGYRAAQTGSERGQQVLIASFLDNLLNRLEIGD